MSGYIIASNEKLIDMYKQDKLIYQLLVLSEANKLELIDKKLYKEMIQNLLKILKDEVLQKQEDE